MRAPAFGLAVAFLGIAPGAAQPPLPDAARPRILVGPDILVSRDGDFQHVELMVAANPRQPRNLVGAAITPFDDGNGTTSYASFDGGLSWRAAGFREALGDPQVAFTQKGTALFTTLAEVARDGHTGSALYVYRSEDGGLTWSRPVDLGASYDHEQIVVDRTMGARAGRVYLGALWGYPVYRVGVFRSDDDGRTWTGPVESANGGGELGVNVCPMQVLSDGALFVPYIDFEFKLERHWGDRVMHFWSVVSTDGGITFSGPRPIVTVIYPETPPTHFQPFPMFAADTLGSTFRNRIYAAWNVVRDGRPQIVTAWSADRGKSWSDARPLPAAASGEQFQPALAVNDQGVLGITWYETVGEGSGEGCAHPGCFNEYFTASVDGGLTLLPPVRVSSVPSYSRWRLSTENSHGNGGDYMGLTADREGAFHPFWADSRSGTFQIYTAVVKVEVPAASTVPAAKSAGEPVRARQPTPPATENPKRRKGQP
ncbi:MAG TPA: sialidase family protein [Thermoanaerobaculia bacterium]|nr:sialidase family protein [Thermoanaerobaculia bacterium]